MEISAFMFLTDQTITPTDLAVALEERRVPALWVPEHPHVPVKRSTPVPAAYGGDPLPEMYLRLLDPMVALTAAAMATERLRVGTGITLLALRDAVVTAKAVATLDLVSGGRFDLGVGYGWNADEFEDHGQRFADRHAVVREKVEVMRRLWTDEVASYQGNHVHLQHSWSWPKPGPGRPRVWLGGNGQRTMREAAAWADGWFPTASAPDLAAQVPRFRAMVADAGRDPAQVAVGVAAAPPDPKLLAGYAEIGIQEVSVVLPVAERNTVLRGLDDLARLRDSLTSGATPLTTGVDR